MNRYIKSFSMAEMLVAMIIIMVFLVAAFPVITARKKANGTDLTTIACIKDVLAQNSGYDISESACGSNQSNACCVTVKNCMFNLNNSCMTIKYYADNGKSNAEIYASRKLFREICDRGGLEGCEYFVNLCNKNSASCEVDDPALGVNYDLDYYLRLKSGNANMGIQVIQPIAQEYYNNGYSNITTVVDLVGTPCTCPTVNLACIVKGTVCSGEGVTSTPWEKKFGGTGDDEGYGIAVDSGNVYITGFENTDSIDGIDILAMKLDSNGNVVWKKKFGGTGNDSGGMIAVDSGNIFLTGSEFTDHIGSFNYDDIFAMKLDANGNVVWKKKFGGTVGDYGGTIAVESGFVYLSASGESDSAGETDIHAMKLDSNGNIIWKKKIGGSGHDSGSALVESGNMYIIGSQDTEAAVSYSLFAMKLDTNGNVVWKKRFGGAAEDHAYSVALESGYLYFTGEETSDSAGNNDTFVIKLDTNGNIVWKKKMGGTGYDLGTAIAVESGCIYLTGFQSTDSAGYNDAFVIKLDTNGNVVWRKKMGGTGDDYAAGIAVESGIVYLTGFQNTDTSGNYDVVTIKLLANQTSNLSSAFNTVDLSSAFDGSDLSSTFNGATLTITTGDLSSSFSGADLNSSFDGVLLNKTRFLGLD